MKAIQLLVNSQLPPDLRDYSRSMDAKSISNLMADVARKYPEQYERISKSVSDIGRNAAYIQGETLTLNDNKPVIDLHAILKEMDDEVDAARKSTPDKDEFEAKRNSIWEKFNERIDKDTSSAALTKGNNLAYSVVSGARGKSQQLKMMISTPGLYTDAQDDLVPIFVRNSFGEGLRPAEYLASTYGARKSVLCLHEDTLVRKPDGSSVAIKDIKVDDVVMGADIQSNKMPVAVVAVYKQGRQPVNKYIFRKAGSNAARSVTCTENHKFLATTVNGVEVLPIKDIIYSNVLLLDGAVWRLTDVEEVGLKYCYDIEVDNEDHLFVLEPGIIVSNSTKRATAKGGDLCLVKGTSVRMADGTEKNIEDISIGDKVLGCSTSGVATPVDVVNTFYQGYKQTYDICVAASKGSRKDSIIGCTLDHKFLVCDKDHPAKEYRVLPIKDKTTRTTLVRPNTFNCDSLEHNPYALLVGLFMGDGTFPDCIAGDKSRCMFTCADDSLISDTKDYVEALGLHWQQRLTQKIQYRLSKSPAAYAHPFKSVLRTLGLNGSRAATKHLPTCVWQWDNTSVLAFLAGYLATDGSITHKTAANKFYKYISVTSVSRQLLVDIKAILSIRFGVSGSEVFEITADKKTGFVSSISSYSFSISRNRDCLLLLRSMPRIPGVKGDKQQEWLRTITAVPDKLVNFASAIKGLTYAGIRECYDIEVDHPDHLFVLANGIVTSNSKQMTQSAAHIIVSENDCGVGNGIALDMDDRSVRGRVLAREVGGLPAGTALDRDAMAALRRKGVTKVIARSAMTCQSKEGVCSKCLGLNALGKFPMRGESVGITAANSIGEPITQGALNVKHQGGAAGTSKRYAGFPVINQFVQSPEVFPDKAVVSTIDGTVSSIMDAPQGGFYITVNNEPHYVPPGYPAIVKVGDKVEAGDIMTQGLPDPGDVVDYKGLGAGRKYYADKLKELLDDSGMEADRRNTELMARAALDHVQITGVPDDESGYIPDDVISYSSLSNTYVPPTNTTKGPTKKFIGSYLQAPALHYTIGTKITPKLSKELDDLGYGDVYASPTEPVFKAVMPRLRSAAHNNTDWLASMHTSYLKKQISESAIRGEDTNIESNTHFAPRLAIGANFGDNITQTGKF